MIPKPLDKVALNDLTDLIGRVREGKTIEYKAELPVTNEAQVKFLAGVSALANTFGGDFIIGVSANDDGYAQAVDGVAMGSVDEEKLRLENIMRTGLEPRLPVANIHPVACADGKHVLVIRLARSWVGPHRVIKNDKFYGRNSAGKYPLDVGELRTAFNLTESIADRIRAFRTDRLARLLGGETPVPLCRPAVLALHVIPLPTFADRSLLDLVPILAAGTHVPLPLTGQGTNRLLANLDGVVNFHLEDRSKVDGYAQLFRTGAIEGVLCLPEMDGEVYVPATHFSNLIMGAAKQYVATLSSLSASFPMFAMISLVGASGTIMRTNSHFGASSYFKNGPLVENVAALPEVTIDSATADVAEVLRPILNMFWNAYGASHCDLYDANGKWRGTA